MTETKRRTPRKTTCKTCFGLRIVHVVSLDPHELRNVFAEEACPACGGLGVTR